MRRLVFVSIVVLVLSSCVVSPLPEIGKDSEVRVVYVSLTGDDGNSGLSKDKPVKSIQLALFKAWKEGINYIYLAEGEYTPNNGLNQPSEYSGIVITNGNIRIVGGWNSDFSKIVGKSILNGQGQLKHVIFASNLGSLKLYNLIITGGYADDYDASSIHSRGGGVYVYNTMLFEMSNTIVISNKSIQVGGGLYLNKAYTVRIYGDIGYNKSYWAEGDLYIWNSTNVVIQGNIFSNSKGVYIVNSENINFNGNAFNNSYGVKIQNSTNVLIVGSIYDNNSSGVHLEGSSNVIIKGTLVSNDTGIYGYFSQFSVLDAFISYNNDGIRGWYLNYMSILNCDIFSNYNGIYLYGCGNIIIYNSLIQGGQFGGIFSDSLDCSFIGNVFTGNSKGLSLIGVQNFVVSNSVFKSNDIGLEVIGGSSNFVVRSTFSDNQIGIDLIGYLDVFEIVNSFITNNIATNILLGDVNKFLISNSVVGGNSGCGIYEKVGVVNHIIKDNKFITNGLEWIYYDFVNGFTNDINAVNDTSYSGALESSGNVIN